MVGPAFPAPENTPTAAISRRVAAMLGTEPQRWRPVRGGHTQAGRWLVEDVHGRSAFVKVDATEQTAGWLRAEWHVYGQIAAPFLPAVLGWDNGDAETSPILILEDLSAAHWPPPWSPELIQRTLEAPDTFLALGLCSHRWLERALPTLLAAEQTAVLAGDSFLHSDVRSDNLCLAADRLVLVDWNWACRGNARADVAGWLPSLHSEGGPRPEEILPDEPGFAALLSGYWAARAGLPPPVPGSPARMVQLRQLRDALPWAARALGLPPLDSSAV